MLSLDHYRAVLARPALRHALLASIIGRLPIGMAGLALTLMVKQASDSFLLAGGVTAAYIAGLAFIGPVVGRLIDRIGPTRPMRAMTIAYPAFLCLLASAVLWQAPVAVCLALAALSGLSYPPINTCLRTFLRRRLHDDEPRLAAAYSLDSVLIETIFIVGPLFVAALVVGIAPAAGVFAAAAAGLAGGLLFLRSPAVRRWRIEPTRRSSLVGPLADRGFPSLLLAVIAYSVAFGLVEIGIVGYAAEEQSLALAGLMLGVMSAGSVAGGLAYGSRHWAPPLHRQFALALACMAVGLALLSLFRHPLPFALASAVAGLAMAPALTIQAMLVARTATPAHAAEAFTWSSTSLLAGVGLGIAGGGALLEIAPSGVVFLAAGAISLVGAGLAAKLLGRS